MQLQLQFMNNIQYTQCSYNYNSWKTFNIHNATTITIHEKHLNIHNTTAIHEKHLMYTIQLQLQFMKNI